MAKEKTKTVFFCQVCGHESAKWMGQCPSCRSWNSFVEEASPAVREKKVARARTGGAENKPAVLHEISMEEELRTTTGIGELDRVLGGGIVAGSLTLVGGDPGIGKSTLLLQMCKNLAAHNRRTLYVSGEESLRQIKMRAQRIGEFTDALMLYCETDLEEIEAAIEKLKPEVVIIDSIQTMFSQEVSAAREAFPRCGRPRACCCGWQREWACPCSLSGT